MGQSRMRIANWWYSRKEYPVAVKCYKKALQFYNNIPTNQVRTGMVYSNILAYLPCTMSEIATSVAEPSLFGRLRVFDNPSAPAPALGSRCIST